MLLSIALLLAAVEPKATASVKFKLAGVEAERPLIKEVSVNNEALDVAFHVTFDRAPSGAACENRCANATLFVDTDHDKSTGLKLSDTKALENGADVALVFQGRKSSGEEGETAEFLIRIKKLANEAGGHDDPALLHEFDMLRDKQRMHVRDANVVVMLDTSENHFPLGRRMRLIYHPPGSTAVEGVVTGPVKAAGARKVQVVDESKKKKGAR